MPVVVEAVSHGNKHHIALIALDFFQALYKQPLVGLWQKRLDCGAQIQLVDHILDRVTLLHRETDYAQRERRLVNDVLGDSLGNYLGLDEVAMCAPVTK